MAIEFQTMCELVTNFADNINETTTQQDIDNFYTSNGWTRREFTIVCSLIGLDLNTFTKELA